VDNLQPLGQNAEWEKLQPLGQNAEWEKLQPLGQNAEWEKLEPPRGVEPPTCALRSNISRLMARIEKLNIL
jgi:hypothetical protein